MKKRNAEFVKFETFVVRLDKAKRGEADCDVCTLHPDCEHTNEDGDAAPAVAYVRIGDIGLYVCKGHKRDMEWKATVGVNA